MKPKYTPLAKLTDKSKGFKVKVKVIHKGPSTESPSKRRYQKLTFKDDEGNTMRGALFGADIDVYEQAIQRNGEYEISDVTIKPIPSQFSSRTGEYQMSLGGRMQIRPLDLSSCSNEPQYRVLADVPHTNSKNDEYIDVVVVVLFVGSIRPVKYAGADHQVRDIIVADQSVCRPMKLSAWNQLAVDTADFLTSWAEKFHIIGFSGVRSITYRGLSLATSLSTQYVSNPSGDKTDAVRLWASQNMSRICPSLKIGVLRLFWFTLRQHIKLL